MTVRILALAGVLCCGPSGGAQSGVKVESRVDARDNGTAIVTNLAPVPLVAYLLEVMLEPCNPLQPRSTLRAADAVLSPDAKPLQRLESRVELLGSSPCNKVGAPIPNRAEFRAAIFQDGSIAGDPASVTALLDRRRIVLEQCEAILDRLRAPDAAGTSVAALTADLRARAAATLERRPALFAPLVDLAALATAQLGSSPVPSADQIARGVKELERWRQKLLDAKPSVR